MEESQMKLKPMADNVLLKQYEAPETTFSGIVLATATKEKSIVSEVVAVGPGTEEHPMTVKVGDQVITDKYAGTSVKMGDEEFVIVRLSDILAIVD